MTETQHELLTELRVPVISGIHPDWNYVACLAGVDPDGPPRGSSARPTEREARQLASFTQEYMYRWYFPRVIRQLAEQPFDVDEGCNTTVFVKYGPDDWAYRYASWGPGQLLWPSPPRLRSAESTGPLSLEQLMDHLNISWHGGPPSEHWLQWKIEHPDVFGAES